jgi:hypothetical protein
MSLASIYTTRCTGRGVGVAALFPPAHTTFFGFARQALVDALRRSGVGAGDAVLIPGFICRDVLASLAAVGAVPRYYDVDEALRSDAAALDRAAPLGARAVVAVNYFGFPQPLEPFRRWCQGTNTTIIEDNAHGLLSRDGDVPLGHRADFGVFSFRKTLAVPNGAALVDGRAVPVPATLSIYRGSPRGLEWRYRAKTAMRLAMGLGGVRAARVLIDASRMMQRALSGERRRHSSAESEHVVPQASLAPLTMQLLAAVDIDAECERRRALYRECRERFDRVGDVHPIFPDLAPGVVPQGFPFFFTGADAPAFVARWWRVGVPIVPWPDLPEAVVADAPRHYRRAMLVPFLW